MYSCLVEKFSFVDSWSPLHFPSPSLFYRILFPPFLTIFSIYSVGFLSIIVVFSLTEIMTMFTIFAIRMEKILTFKVVIKNLRQIQ